MTTTPALWNDLTQVNTTDGGKDQHNPQVTSLQNGGYVAVWTDANRPDNLAGSFIMGQVYDFAGNKVGGEVKLGQFGSGTQLAPAVTTLSNGNIAVAFWDDSADDIYVRIFDPVLNFVRTDIIATAGPTAIRRSLQGARDTRSATPPAPMLRITK